MDVDCTATNPCIWCRMLLGNLVSILLSAIITVTGSLIWPADYDFVSMRQIALDDDVSIDDDLGAHT